MSGVVKGIVKIFKKIVHVVKKIIKPILIAAAIYFTAGLALAAMPATAAFAASLPGFAGGGLLGLGVGAGATAGTGLFSTLAANLGLGSGLASGALAAGTSGSALTAAGFSTATVAGAIAPAAATGAGASAIAAAGGGAAAGAGAGAVAAKAGMTLGEKLLLASTATKTLGGLLAPSPKQIAEAQKRWVGAFYGDEGGGAPAAAAPATPAVPAVKAAQPDETGAVASANSGTRQLPADTVQARQLIAQQPAQKPVTSAPQKQYQYSADPTQTQQGYQYGASKSLIPEPDQEQTA